MTHIRLLATILKKTKQYIASLILTLCINALYSQSNKGTWTTNQCLAPLYIAAIPPKVGDTITFMSRDSVTEVGSKQTSPEFSSVEFDLKFAPNGKAYHYECRKITKCKWKLLGTAYSSDNNELKLTYNNPFIDGYIWLKSDSSLVHNSKWIVTKVSLNE